MAWNTSLRDNVNQPQPAPTKSNPQPQHTHAHRGYVHFQGRGRTFQLPTGPRARITAVVLVGGGLSYYLYCREEVPYTHRMHSIMLVSTANEQWMGSMVFQEVGASGSGYVVVIAWRGVACADGCACAGAGAYAGACAGA